MVVIIRRAGRVLMIRRGPEARRAGYWMPPGGALEAGETQAHAVIRETFEETGLRVQPVRKIWECPTDDGSFQLHWWIAEPASHELALDAHEVSEARWVDAGELRALEPLFDQHRQFFSHVLPTLTHEQGQ